MKQAAKHRLHIASSVLGLLLLSLLFVKPAWADVAIDGSCQALDAAVVSPIDVTHTVGATANFLVVAVGIDDPTTVPTSATWDFGGTAQVMTSQETADVGVVAGALYTLVNPTPGTSLTLRVTTNTDGGDSPAIVICSFTGVDTATSFGTIVEQESTASQAGSSLAFTLTEGGLALSFLVGQQLWTNFAQGADQTAIATNAEFSGSGSGAFAAAHATVSPLDYTWNSTGIDFWHVVIPINPASAPASRRRVAPIIFQ